MQLKMENIDLKSSLDIVFDMKFVEILSSALFYPLEFCIISEIYFKKA